MSRKKGKLGLFMLIALVTGNMVGSGAFLNPAAMAGIGSISLLSMGFTIIGVLCLALVFAKMSLLVPKAGGPYAYAFAGFGEYMGFQTAYYYWFAVWLGNAAIVVAALGYLSVFFPVVESNPVTKIFTMLGIVWSITIVNIIGVRFAGFFQIITTILKFIPFAIVGILGWWYFQPEYLTGNFNVTATSNFSAFSVAVPITLWLFVGVESATIPTDVVDNPKRNIPLATLLGTIIAAVIYILSNTAIFGMLPNHVLANSVAPFAAATEVIFGSWGKVLVAIVSIIACLGALNGWILVAAQIPLAAANDGLFPKIFAKCNKDETPVAGLVITSSLISLALLASVSLNLIKQFTFLVNVAVLGEVAAYFYTTIAEIIILPKKSLIRTNLFHICVAFLAAAYSFCVILGTSKEEFFYFMAFILLTIPFYAIFRWKRDGSSPV